MVTCSRTKATPQNCHSDFSVVHVARTALANVLTLIERKLGIIGSCILPRLQKAYLWCNRFLDYESHWTQKRVSENHSEIVFEPSPMTKD